MRRGRFLPPRQTGLKERFQYAPKRVPIKSGTDGGERHRAICHRKMRETKLALKPSHLKGTWERGDPKEGEGGGRKGKEIL